MSDPKNPNILYMPPKNQRQRTRRRQRHRRQQQQQTRKHRTNTRKTQRGGEHELTSEDIAEVFEEQFNDQPYIEYDKKKYGVAIATDRSRFTRDTSINTRPDFTISLDGVQYKANKVLGTGTHGIVYSIEKQGASPVRKKSRSDSASSASSAESASTSEKTIFRFPSFSEATSLEQTSASSSQREDDDTNPPTATSLRTRSSSNIQQQQQQESGIRALKQIKMFDIIESAIANYRRLPIARFMDEATDKKNIKIIIKQQLAVILNEINMLQKIKLYCAEYFLCYDSIYFEQGDRVFNIYIVTEHLEGDELFNYVSDTYEASQKIPPEIIYKIMNDIMNGIVGLHEIGLAHCDIKPENIYLIKDTAGNIQSAKIIDFGMCKEIEAGKMYPFIGTPNYMLPEVLYRQTEFDSVNLKLNDLWGAALIGFLMHNTYIYSGILDYIGKTYNLNRSPGTEDEIKRKIATCYKIYRDYLRCNQRELKVQYKCSSDYDKFITNGYKSKYFMIDLRDFLIIYYSNDGPRRIPHDQKYEKILTKPKANLPEDWHRFPKVSPSVWSDALSIIGGNKNKWGGKRRKWPKLRTWTTPAKTYGSASKTIYMSESGKIIMSKSGTTEPLPPKPTILRGTKLRPSDDAWITLDLSIQP